MVDAYDPLPLTSTRECTSSVSSLGETDSKRPSFVVVLPSWNMLNCTCKNVINKFHIFHPALLFPVVYPFNLARESAERYKLP